MLYYAGSAIRKFLTPTRKRIKLISRANVHRAVPIQLKRSATKRRTRSIKVIEPSINGCAW